MITRNFVLHITCFVLISSASRAFADDAPTAEDNVSVGLAAQSAPRYSGADQHHWQVVPVVQARKGAFFFDSLKGLGYDLQSQSGVYLEHTLGYSLGRADRNSNWRDGADKLQGMGNIAATVNTALAVGWTPMSWLAIEGKATLPLSDDQGVHYQTSVTLIPIQNETDTLAFQSAAMFGDRRYMNTFYGVSNRQSERSGYTAYQAAGGFYGVDNTLTWSHQFTKHWTGALTADYIWLGNHADDSPIVFRRSGTSGSVALLYTF